MKFAIKLTFNWEFIEAKETILTYIITEFILCFYKNERSDYSMTFIFRLSCKPLLQSNVNLSAIIEKWHSDIQCVFHAPTDVYVLLSRVLCDNNNRTMTYLRRWRRVYKTIQFYADGHDATPQSKACNKKSRYSLQVCQY